MLDEDGDGCLTNEEMKVLLQSQFMVFTDGQVDETLRELDEDGELYDHCSLFTVYCLLYVFPVEVRINHHYLAIYSYAKTDTQPSRT